MDHCVSDKLKMLDFVKSTSAKWRRKKFIYAGAIVPRSGEIEGPQSYEASRSLLDLMPSLVELKKAARKDNYLGGIKWKANSSHMKTSDEEGQVTSIKISLVRYWSVPRSELATRVHAVVLFLTRLDLDVSSDSLVLEYLQKLQGECGGFSETKKKAAPFLLCFAYG